MSDYILVLNAGSITLKFELFEGIRKLTTITVGSVERIGLPGSFISLKGSKLKKISARTHTQALREVFDVLPVPLSSIRAVGHRVVHGGERYQKPTLVTAAVLKWLEQYASIAPLHNPVNVAVIKTSKRMIPNKPHVAVFDTAFFSSLKPEHFLYAIPYLYYKKFGIRRYGFHGISHEYVTKQAAIRLRKKRSKINLITLHLGNGCSVAAIKQGRPLTTSMGYTPLEGLVMGTRSGNIDPAVPLILQRKLKQTPAQIERMLNTESGIRGLTGFTSDMREVLKAAGQSVTDYHGKKTFSQKERAKARLTLNIFINSLQHYIAAYGGLLGFVDAIVFTGGIGERSAAVRRLALRGLTISGRPCTLTIPTREELSIAQQVTHSVYLKL